MRYYFGLTDGKEVLPAKGLELPGNAAAREEATLLARELKEGKVMPGRKWDGWFIEVKDRHGHRVDVVPVAPVPAPPPPLA